MAKVYNFLTEHYYKLLFCRGILITYKRRDFIKPLNLYQKLNHYTHAIEQTM